MVPSQSDHCFIDRGHPPFPVWPECWLTTIPPIEGLEDELTHIDKGIVISLSRTPSDTHWEKLYAFFVHYANTSESLGLALQSPFLPQSLPERTVRYASISFDNLRPKSPSDHVQHWDQPTEHHCSPCLKLDNGGRGVLSPQQSTHCQLPTWRLRLVHTWPLLHLTLLHTLSFQVIFHIQRADSTPHRKSTGFQYW